MSRSVVARFYVHEITENNTDYAKVVLKPVVRAGGLPGAAEADAANKQWSKYTPSGEWWMNVHTSTGAVDTFRDAMREKKDLAITVEVIE
jgi:hypothetical protein